MKRFFCGFAALLSTLGSPACQQPDDDVQVDGSQHAPIEEPGDNKATGGYRGYKAINQLINERVFARNDALQLRTYIEPPVDPNEIFAFTSPKLAELLGIFDGDGLRSGMRNATPNAVNMLLWYMTFDSLANELSAPCAEPVAESTAHFSLEDVKTDIRSTVTALCAWPEVAPEANPDQLLADLWTQVMRYDAPEAEFQSWKSYVRNPSFLARYQGPSAIKALLFPIFYNPHFLLSK